MYQRQGRKKPFVSQTHGPEMDFFLDLKATLHVQIPWEFKDVTSLTLALSVPFSVFYKALAVILPSEPCCSPGSYREEALYGARMPSPGLCLHEITQWSSSVALLRSMRPSSLLTSVSPRFSLESSPLMLTRLQPAGV